MPSMMPMPTRVALLLVTALATASCSDDPAGPAAQSPALPPLASLQADMTLFDGAAGAAALPTAASSSAGVHFLTAAVTAGIARTATVAVMAVPVATFAAAASVDPVFEDGAFHWRYSIVSDGATFVADLAGRGAGAESMWEMRITTNATNPPLDGFLWYDGRAQLTGQAGEWHIYDATQASASVELLAVGWTHPSVDAWTLSFTNVNPASADVGDVLTYEVAGTLRTMRFHDASAGTDTVIEWHSATGTGSIHAPGYNGGERACWDAAQNNTPCGSAP